MKTVAFKMHLNKGQREAYKKRHDEIWPELKTLLFDAGIREYYIFLDEETDFLFATMKVTDDNTVKSLPAYPIMQKWWEYMADIMETHEDNSPVTASLMPVFIME